MALLQYREFYKLYFQLFSSILGISKFGNTTHKFRIIEAFADKFHDVPLKEIQDFFLLQNIFFAKQMMEKRNYLVNIHKCIGNKKYNELFGKEIEYLRLSQSIVDGSLKLDLTNIKMQFSEAILHMCNSFQLLAGQCGLHNTVILNGEKTPFLYINEELKNNNHSEYLSDYKKELYEMILNYKYYYKEFN